MVFEWFWGVLWPRISEWYLNECYSEWSNGILNDFLEVIQLLRQWYSEWYTIQNTIDEDAEELLINTTENTTGPFRIPFSQVPFRYY